MITTNLDSKNQKIDELHFVNCDAVIRHIYFKIQLKLPERKYLVLPLPIYQVAYFQTKGEFQLHYGVIPRIPRSQNTPAVVFSLPLSLPPLSHL